MEEHMLSTVDNPFNPFHHFDEWNAWDTANGYHTLALLGRIIITSPELSDADEDAALEYAIEEIVRENVSGVHISVTENSVVPRQTTNIAV